MCQRSKTADIERMLHISQDKNSKVNSGVSTITTTTTTTTSSTSSDSKKYTKRRYTDSRHQTRHIPDADSLVDKSPSAITSVSTSSSVVSISNSQGQQRNSVTPVWKRREIISSAPTKDRQNYF